MATPHSELQQRPAHGDSRTPRSNHKLFRSHSGDRQITAAIDRHPHNEVGLYSQKIQSCTCIVHNFKNTDNKHSFNNILCSSNSGTVWINYSLSRYCFFTYVHSIALQCSNLSSQCTARNTTTYKRAVKSCLFRRVAILVSTV